MTSRRFRWSRSKYRKAESLARYFARHVYDLPSEPPDLVRRYFELWERHPQRQDELQKPFRNRRRTIEMLDSIPF